MCSVLIFRHLLKRLIRTFPYPFYFRCKVVEVGFFFEIIPYRFIPIPTLRNLVFVNVLFLRKKLKFLLTESHWIMSWMHWKSSKRECLGRRSHETPVMSSESREATGPASQEIFLPHTARRSCS